MEQPFRIEHKAATHLVGFVDSGSFDTAFEWAERAWTQLLEVDRDYTGPFLTANHARQSEFTMYVGREYNELPTETPEEAVTIQIPAQSYAVAGVQGDQDEVYRKYQQLGQWVAQQGGVVNPNALTLESYPTAPLPRTGELSFEIWLPLVGTESPQSVE